MSKPERFRTGRRRHHAEHRSGASQPPAKVQRRGGSHLKINGQPKVSYLSEETAQVAANRVGCRYYRCETCRCWHVGH